MRLSIWPSSKADLRYDCGWATDVGRVRTRNEDSVLPPTVVSVPGHGEAILAAVADGVGGMDDGAQASSAAIGTLLEAFRPEAEADVASALLRAVSESAARVARLNARRSADAAMASTIVAVAVHGGRAFAVHVGDSRAYLFRGEHLRQLTRDHSLVADAVQAGEMKEEEAKTSSMRNLLTRALGTSNIMPELSPKLALRPSDELFLSSDGIHGVVSAELLAETLRGPGDAQHLADACVRHALEAGAPDNASAVVIRVVRQGTES